MHLGNAENMMPDDFGSYDQEVERRIMAQNVNPRPKQMYPNYPRPVAAKKHIVDEIIEEINASEEAELTREILDAARKANVCVSIIETSSHKSDVEAMKIQKIIRHTTGWIGPG